MRIRMLPLSVVLVLVTIGSVVAQQTITKGSTHANEKLELRAKVIEMRARIEFLKLEHEVEKDHCIEALRRFRQYASKSPQELRRETESAVKGDADVISERSTLLARTEEELHAAPPEETDEILNKFNYNDIKLVEKKIELSLKSKEGEMRLLYEGAKKSYEKSAARLAAMVLDSEEAERKYKNNE